MLVRSTTRHGPTQRESSRASIVHPPGMKCILASTWVPVWALRSQRLTVLGSPRSVWETNSWDGAPLSGHMTDFGLTVAVMSMISTTPPSVLLRAVAVGVLEDVYEAGAGLEPGGVLGAGGYVVGVAWSEGPGLAVYGQVQAAGDDDAPLGAVGVRRHLELLGGAEEDRLAVRAGEQPALEPREGRVRLGKVVHPVRKRVHISSSPTFAPPIRVSL